MRQLIPTLHIDIQCPIPYILLLITDNQQLITNLSRERVIAIGRTSITWGWGYRGGDEEDMVVEGNNVTICVTTDTFEKQAVPEWLKLGLMASMRTFSRS